MRLLVLMNFITMVLPLARLHSCPLKFWLRETYSSPAELFNPLNIKYEMRGSLLWWHWFVLQHKQVHCTSVREIITTDALTEDNGDNMNNLSFKGKWSGKNCRKIHISLLEKEMAQNAFLTVIKGDEGDVGLFSDRQHDSHGLFDKGGQTPARSWSLVEKNKARATVCQEY